MTIMVATIADTDTFAFTDADTATTTAMSIK